MPKSFTGGCACGAVRYESSMEPLMAGTCHCRDCQRASGGFGAPMLFVPKAALKVTGEVKYHEVTADSGSAVRRGFCPSCGSPLFGKPDVMPDAVGIRAGSLDDPSWFQPSMDVFTASAQPWDHMDPHVPKFAKGPEPPAA